MKSIAVVGVCEVIIIWIIATYIPLGICRLRGGSVVSKVGYMLCLGFTVKTPK